MAQYKGTLYVKTDTDEFYLKGRSCELSAFSFIPPEHNVTKERTVYNSDKKVSEQTIVIVYIGYGWLEIDIWFC